MFSRQRLPGGRALAATLAVASVGVVAGSAGAATRGPVLATSQQPTPVAAWAGDVVFKRGAHLAGGPRGPDTSAGRGRPPLGSRARTDDRRLPHGELGGR